MKTLIQRHRTLVLYDPRCYNGCYKDARLEWTSWSTLESKIPDDQAENRLAFWKDLNDYAVSQRGKEAKREFKLIDSI